MCGNGDNECNVYDIFCWCPRDIGKTSTVSPLMKPIMNLVAHHDSIAQRLHVVV